MSLSGFVAISKEWKCIHFATAILLLPMSIMSQFRVLWLVLFMVKGLGVHRLVDSQILPAEDRNDVMMATLHFLQP